MQKTEILNESIGLGMGYSYLMLVNIVSERKERHYIGMTIVAIGCAFNIASEAKKSNNESTFGSPVDRAVLSKSVTRN